MGTLGSKDVLGLTQDHRQVQPGFVFVAIAGTKVNGHQFIPEAIAQGAIALVVEETKLIPENFMGAVVQVPNSRLALESLAKNYFGRPTENIFCVGVTGTNGKTSTCLMVEKVLNDFSWPTGVLGTIDHHLGQKTWKSELTTPDPVTLYRRLSEFRALGAKAAAFEVSSHALDQGRADTIDFDVCIFTNLTRDHLDYHGTMEKYFEAKQKLFTTLALRNKTKKAVAIVNISDPWGKKLQVAERLQKITYGEIQSDFQFQVKKIDFSGSHFQLKTLRGVSEGFLPMPGRHNVYNAVAAIATGWFAGRSIDSSIESLSNFSGVPGRLQKVPTDKNIHVFVDFAHTDDALRTVLSALDQIRKMNSAKSRILTVFGCGGDRDKGKRPLMAQAALEVSDQVFVTSDNPRTEDPMRIIQDIVADISKIDMQNKVVIEADRREAIGKALRQANEGDVVVIAGKGHEDYQIIGDQKKNFSDFLVAKDILGKF